MTIFPSKLEITKQKTKQNNNNNNQIDPCYLFYKKLTASPGGPASPTVPCFPVSP